MAGQGTVGLELLEDVPEPDVVLVPVGGGGLCAGIALALKASRPGVHVIGVQAAACAPYLESLRRAEAVAAASAFVAAGAAGALRLPAPGDGAAGDDGVHHDRSTAGDVVAEVRRRRGTVVATGGCFDILHAGHVALLEGARALGDCLVVCLNSDASVRRLKGPHRPFVGQADRAALLSALACVDAVVTFDEDTPEAVLERIRPDIFVKGGDYGGAELPEARVLERWGGQAVVLPYVEGRSSSGLAREVARRATR
jgi:rfaE bifunctional protein nucleotidyltransferase chain/domain